MIEMEQNEYVYLDDLLIFTRNNSCIYLSMDESKIGGIQ